jgi:hypothetical protein
MAFKMKSALKFGQKTAFKMKSYSPAKQKKSTEVGNKVMGYDKVVSQGKGKLKDWLMDSKGFNQEDADRMIADGAYTFKDVIKDLGMDKDVKDNNEDKSVSTEPFKQEGPIDKKNLPLQPGEHEGTWLYEGEGFEPGGNKNEKFNAQERIFDLEDRAEFARQDAEGSSRDNYDPTAKQKKQYLKTAKKLQHEADIMRKRTQNERSAVKQKAKCSCGMKSCKCSPAKQKETKKQVRDRLKAEQDFMGTKNWIKNELNQMSPSEKRKLPSVIKESSVEATEEISKNKNVSPKKKTKAMAVVNLPEIEISASPNKQTKSRRGNIFTKKGRNQKIVNRHAKLTDKQLESNAKLDEYGTVKELNKFDRITKRKKRTEKKMEKRDITRHDEGFAKGVYQRNDSNSKIGNFTSFINPKSKKNK